MTKYESPVSHQYHKNTICPKTFLETPFKFFRQKTGVSEIIELLGHLKVTNFITKEILESA